jgi:hypothetical protein
MGTAAILAILLAAVGPILLPFAFAKAGRGAAYAFCATNLITLLPMAGIAAWHRYLLPPSCRHAPCDGIPTEVGWFFITLIFILLTCWSLLATAAIATSSPPFRKG